MDSSSGLHLHDLFCQSCTCHQLDQMFQEALDRNRTRVTREGEEGGRGETESSSSNSYFESKSERERQRQTDRETETERGWRERKTERGEEREGDR